MRFKSVLFDHDGTLVNSEGIHFGLWCQTLLPHGVNLTEAEYKAHFVGIPSKHSAVDVVRRHGLSVVAHELTRQKEALTQDYLRQQAFPLMPGAHDAVAALRAHGVRLGVVTGAGPDGIEATLRDHGWRSSFDTVVTAADVPHSKPAPDVYELALARLGLLAHEAVAIEDTATGVAAARAAGLRCLAIPHEHSATQDFSAATVVLKSMAQAMAWLRDHA